MDDARTTGDQLAGGAQEGSPAGGPARRVLLAFPRYAPSFGTMEHAFPVTGARAFMPPQGLLTVAGYLPEHWPVRFVDENVKPVSHADLDWAEVVMVSGMHVQREAIRDLLRRASAAGRLTVLGGPSASACPEWYPEADILHLGELGDGTDSLVARLRAGTGRPAAQERFATVDRLPLDRFPRPAYQHVSMSDYLLGSVQYSSGCPYHCEFCDIPSLYGNRTRVKEPAQVLAELDAMLTSGNPGAVYFVDDNFAGNPKAATGLLEALVSWQQSRGYPVEFACEASLDVAKRPRILELMRQARITTMFCGIETPETEALRGLKKTQNLRTPILDAVATINGYGIEVVSGIILGLDTDTPDTYRNVLSFIERSAIPMCTVNLLQALPGTPLHRRLEAAGRLSTRAGRSTNVEFLLPEDVVVEGWRRVISAAFEPAALFRRYEHQMTVTYPARLRVPTTRARLRPELLRRGLRTLAGVVWVVGVRAPYRRQFWRFAKGALGRRQFEELLQAAAVAHHLISFSAEAAAGVAEQSFYAPAGRTA